jgi:hypothetical protein
MVNLLFCLSVSSDIEKKVRVKEVKKYENKVSKKSKESSGSSRQRDVLGGNGERSQFCCIGSA